MCLAVHAAAVEMLVKAGARIDVGEFPYEVLFTAVSMTNVQSATQEAILRSLLTGLKFHIPNQKAADQCVTQYNAFSGLQFA